MFERKPFSTLVPSLATWWEVLATLCEIVLRNAPNAAPEEPESSERSTVPHNPACPGNTDQQLTFPAGASTEILGLWLGRANVPPCKFCDAPIYMHCKIAKETDRASGKYFDWSLNTFTWIVADGHLNFVNLQVILVQGEPNVRTLFVTFTRVTPKLLKGGGVSIVYISYW